MKFEGVLKSWSLQGMAFIFSLCFVAPSYSQPKAQTISSTLIHLFHQADVIYLGENHTTDLHRKFMPEILKTLVEAGVISAFATEAVFADQQDVFDRYLKDPRAEAGSPEELAYFLEIGREMSWLDSPDIREQFRTLRELKLKHGSAFKICGVDVPTELDQTPERRAQMHSRLQALSPEAQQILQNLSGQSLEALVESGQLWDREVHMGKAAADCMEGQSRMLVQVGAFHAWSVQNSFERGQGWWAMTQWHNHWSSEPVRLLTVVQGTTHERTSSYFWDQAMRAAEAYFQSEDFVFIDSRNFPSELKKYFTLSGAPFYPLADYWIFGPRAERVVFDRYLRSEEEAVAGP